MIEIRRARHDDKKRIEEISRDIWEGDDYLPQVFDAWVEETGGEFSVITVDGRVAGCAKITELPGRVLWLEGIRVDKAYRGQGLGKKMAEYQLERAQGMGASRIELGTFIENYESLAIIEKRGFVKVAGFKFMMKPLTEKDGEDCLQISSDCVERIKSLEDLGGAGEIMARLASEPRLGYVGFDWTFMRCTEALLDRLILQEALYRVGDTIFAFGRWKQKDDGVSIHFLYGDRDVPAALEYIEESARTSGAASVMIMSSGGEKEQAVLSLAGYESFTDAEEDAFVYRYEKGSLKNSRT